MAPSSSHFAALSDASLDEVCASVSQALDLSEFEIDSEHEGADWWEYASVSTGDVLINLCRLGHYTNSATWRWMWGAPRAANFQVVLTGKREHVIRAKDAVERVIGPLTPYPSDFFIK